jgi:phage-related tail fiber protein
MGIKVANNAFATLASGITSSATSITVASGQGARFPTLGAGDYFYATLINTSNQLEIVKCTARSADVLTVERAQEGTTARAYDVGDRIEIRITAATFEDATATPTSVTDGIIAAAPSGAVQFFAMNTAPTGWLKANGAAVSRATYAALFAAVGTTFGVGDGSTTFALPDLRGEFLRGWDDGRNVDSGRTFGTGQSSANLGHQHNILTAPHTGSFQYSNGRACFNRGYPLNIGGVYSHLVNVVADGNMPTGLLFADTSGGNESRPRNIALLACIKF